MTVRRYAIIRGNLVIASIMWDPEQFPDYVYPDDHNAMIQHDDAGIGWSYVGGVFTDPDPPDLSELEPKFDNIYPPLEKWRFWAIVRMPGSIGEANLRAAITGHPNPAFSAVAISMLDDPPGGLFYRSNTLFANAAFLGALGLNEAAVNAMWDSAHALALPA